jgi:hypothetical protein
MPTKKVSGFTPQPAVSSGTVSSTSPSTQQVKKVTPRADLDYHAFLARLRVSFGHALASGNPLFTTDVTDLWSVYLAATPEKDRQNSNCNTCKHFIERFGGLVMIDEIGQMYSPIWTENGDIVDALRRRVARSKVTGVFKSSVALLGTPCNADKRHPAGKWQHLSVTLPKTYLHKDGLLDADQKMAALLEDHRTLQLALSAFQSAHLAQALTILEAGLLSRSEKFVGVVKWLQERQADRKLPTGQNLIWYAVATAPTGFCSPRSSMVGSLLDDLAAGHSLEVVKRKFDSKMGPLQYQRAQVAPSEGNIQAAEAAFEKLGLADALERRFALASEAQSFWRPQPIKLGLLGEGVFSHLKPKSASVPTLALPTQTITWVKFQETILEDALKLELTLPARGNYSAMVTQTHEGSKPLLQWDLPEARNPVSLYVYHEGSVPANWGLRAGYPCEVVAICLYPHQWFGAQNNHMGEGIFFILKDAKDKMNTQSAIFADNCRSDLQAFRSTLEAFSKSRKLDHPTVDEQYASGLVATKGQAWNLEVRVTRVGSVQTFKIDRWD